MFCQINKQTPTQRKGKKKWGGGVGRKERKEGGEKVWKKERRNKKKRRGEENKEKERTAWTLTKRLDVLTNLQEVQKINT